MTDLTFETTLADARASAQGLLDFIDASPTPYHAVDQASRALQAAGFEALREDTRWVLEPGRAYYVVRGSGSIIAFRLGTAPAAEAGFRLLGAHTDSPNLRLKPRLAKSAHGYALLDVEPYGGLTLATWTDRDLGLAGQVSYRAGETVQTSLVRFDKALCRIPNLAIHLNRTVNDEGLKLNKHSHVAPVLAHFAGEGNPSDLLKEMLAEAVGTTPGAILGHDLMLYDLQRGAFSGLKDEFFQVARLDNLAMTHACLCALLATPGDVPQTRVIGLYDHEEVGSLSSRGADSSFMQDVLTRIAGDGVDQLPRAVARSHQVSADMAHGVHPCYADKHDGTHSPVMNGGPVIKTNVNTRYATEGSTGALFRLACQLEGVPVQEFVNRPDLACGTTIGPISAGRLGVPTVDVGNPMWAMHSIREMAGTADHVLMGRALARFLVEPGFP
ncbi:MAG: M18 family aminopeptidase [Myxococcales bacterium]|nr:M18 family aminopeptidase [Myxococcales bacterium]